MLGVWQFGSRAMGPFARGYILVVLAALVVVSLLACQQDDQEPGSSSSSSPQPGAQIPAVTPFPSPAPTLAPLTPTDAPTPVPLTRNVTIPRPPVLPEAGPLPSPTPTPAPTATPTPAPAATATSTLAPTVTPAPEEAPVVSPTATPSAEELQVSVTERATVFPEPTPTPINVEAASTAELTEMVPWFADPQGGIHRRAANALLTIRVADANLGRLVAGFPWVVDGMSLNESLALEIISNQAFLDAELASRIVGLDWVADGVDLDEVDSMQYVFGNMSRDRPSSHVLLDYYWVRDGLTTRETWGAAAIMEMAIESPEISLQLATLPWFADGLTNAEAKGFRDLRPFFLRGPDVAGLFLNMPWFVDGINEDDARLAYSLRELVGADFDLAWTVLSHPWVSEETTPSYNHWEPISDLVFVASENLPLARRVAVSLVAGAGTDQQHRIASLRAMFRSHKEAWEETKLQEWYWDGVDADEEAFLLVAPDILINAPDQFYEMHGNPYVEPRSVNLPLSGRVEIRLVNNGPLVEAEALFFDIEMALVQLEKLTGLGLPTQEVIVSITRANSRSEFELSKSNLSSDWPNGDHLGAFIRIPRFESEPVFRQTLFLQLARYYFRGFPTWPMEGADEFAASYILANGNYGSKSQWRSSVEDRIGEHCQSGAGDLSKLAEPVLSEWPQLYGGCIQGLGNLILSALYFSLGEEVMSASLKDILTYTYSRDGGRLTDKLILHFFRQNVKPGQRDELENLFRRLHGGPVTVPIPTGPDDHSDEQSRASGLPAGVTRQGALDHAWDTDYLRLLADEGKAYRVDISHEVRSRSHRSFLRVRIFDSDGNVIRYLLRAGPKHLAETETYWIAPESGAYYVVLDSIYGITGAYSLHVGFARNDDHGNYPFDASPIEFGQELEGFLDSASDVDYFKLETIQRWGYAAVVENVTLNLSKVESYDSDGEFVEPIDWQWGRKGSEISFRSAGDGTYFVKVFSPQGDTGEYMLVVEQQIPSRDPHDDKPSWASPIEIGQLVEGQLNEDTDQDYFRFSVIAGETYHFKVNYLDLFDQPLKLLDTDGETPLGPTRPFGLESYGSILSWVAPKTDDYFVVMHSPDGDLGKYELKIIPGIRGRDDHGNIQSTATDLEVGVPLGGRLDHADDFDFFELNATGGRRYEILVEYDPSVLDETLLSFYDARGYTSYAWHRDGERQGGKYLTWDARYGGNYYVIVWNPRGETGKYTLTVNDGPIPDGARPTP